MPGVVGKPLDVALKDIEQAGVRSEVDVDGGGLFGVIDESNWTVCEQLPEVGGPVSGAPRLTVDRSCGEAAQTPEATTNGPSAAASDSTQGSPSEAATAALEPLTVKTNKDLAAILTLTDYCDEKIVDFADRHQGDAIAFDGSIVAMNNHGDYGTRYDMLINAGDFSETQSIPGPSFQFRDVNTTSDLNSTGSNVPASIGVGTNLRIVAEVDEFETESCLFLIDPISTEFR